MKVEELAEVKEVKNDAALDKVDGQTEIVPKVVTPTSISSEWDYFDGKAIVI